ncbi:uncharacterized protein BcabD6B2_31190 [Babesia caballi]|uniref:Uncharacterized protein n=1 Tax=Babesia caballi TaxID=5871 RepID=A0AAV4LUH9_BABCB|nr:hypothetical protein, conserved [Babesia caballi]
MHVGLDLCLVLPLPRLRHLDAFNCAASPDVYLYTLQVALTRAVARKAPSLARDVLRRVPEARLSLLLAAGRVGRITRAVPDLNQVFGVRIGDAVYREERHIGRAALGQRDQRVRLELADVAHFRCAGGVPHAGRIWHLIVRAVVVGREEYQRGAAPACGDLDAPLPLLRLRERDRHAAEEEFRRNLRGGWLVFCGMLGAAALGGDRGIYLVLRDRLLHHYLEMRGLLLRKQRDVVGPRLRLLGRDCERLRGLFVDGKFLQVDVVGPEICQLRALPDHKPRNIVHRIVVFCRLGFELGDRHRERAFFHLFDQGPDRQSIFVGLCYHLSEHDGLADFLECHHPLGLTGGRGEGAVLRHHRDGFIEAAPLDHHTFVHRVVWQLLFLRQAVHCHAEAQVAAYFRRQRVRLAQRRVAAVDGAQLLLGGRTDC